MADDIIPLRHSYALSMVERISELEAEVERLRAAGDRLAAAVNAVACFGTRDEMTELTDAFLDWEAGRV